MLFDTLPPAVRDPLYVAVGLPIVAAQELDRRLEPVRAQVDSQLDVLRRKVDELVPAAREAGTGRLATFTPPSLSELNARVDEQLKAVEQRLDALEAQVDGALDKLEEHFPEAAREVMDRARHAAKDARTQLLTLVNRAA